MNEKKVFIALIILGFCLSGFILVVDASLDYVGSKESDIYHYPDCRYAEKIEPENLIHFDTPEDTIDADYRPCKVCKPPKSSAPIKTPTPTIAPSITPTSVPAAEVPEESGFEAVFAISGLLAVVYCMLRRRR